MSKSDLKEILNELINKFKKPQKNSNNNTLNKKINKEETITEDLNKKIFDLQKNLKEKKETLSYREESINFLDTVKKKVNKTNDIDYQVAFDSFVKEEENNDQLLVVLINQLDEMKNYLKDKVKEKKLIDVETNIIEKQIAVPKIGFVKAKKKNFNLNI